MARRYGGQYGGRSLVSISFSQQGLDNNFVFFYASSDCSGQAYIETFYYRPVPDRALFEQPTLELQLAGLLMEGRAPAAVIISVMQRRRGARQQFGEPRLALDERSRADVVAVEMRSGRKAGLCRPGRDWDQAG